MTKNDNNKIKTNVLVDQIGGTVACKEVGIGRNSPGAVPHIFREEILWIWSKDIVASLLHSHHTHTLCQLTAGHRNRAKEQQQKKKKKGYRRVVEMMDAGQRRRIRAVTEVLATTEEQYHGATNG